MGRDGISNNFEKMEMLLIADFHLYNLIFCKEELGLDNRKTSILLNIFWHLLKADNPSYIKKDENEERKKKESQKFLNEKDDNILKNKTLEKDLEIFKKLLILHTKTSDQASKMKKSLQKDLFTIDEIKRIIQYAHYAYIDKFRLFTYVFGFKKKNEEKRIVKTISKPTEVPPLVEALYMGHDKQPIVDEEEEEDMEYVRLRCLSFR